MKRFRPYIVGAIGGVLGLVLLVFSGILNLGASPGGSPVFDWLHEIGVRQSVSLRSADIEVPPLDDPAMIRRGAGHYELVCAQCHGSPSRPAAAIADGMTPKPPPLVDRMGNWRPDARVFWTIKHGIRRSAMPAWPTQLRDDEVWNVVAFLEQLPELSADEYEALVGGPGTETCVRCHGEDGRGVGGAFPRLDIQSPDYLAAALIAFRQGTRASGTMMAVARGLSDEAMVRLAKEYGRSLPVAPPVAGSPGAEIARRGIPERDVPACDSCHGGAARPDYPRLAGQPEAYILTQLKLFATLGADRGGRHADLMAKAVRGLSEADMRALAEWYGE